MGTSLKMIRSLFVVCALVLMTSCKNTVQEESIVGHYETIMDPNDQRITYYITHIKDNLYGIKVNVSFNGTDTQTNYLEGSYNPEERILATKRSNVVLNYRFSSDYRTVELLGDENDIKLSRK